MIHTPLNFDIKKRLNFFTEYEPYSKSLLNHMKHSQKKNCCTRIHVIKHTGEKEKHPSFSWCFEETPSKQNPVLLTLTRDILLETMTHAWFSSETINFIFLRRPKRKDIWHGVVLDFSQRRVCSELCPSFNLEKTDQV
ncbi:uncharacterized protein LOC122427551 isoform X2 [Cervus canadensis]|uniref:uncharacterized protein LOC122427551 isoform X2 n=1 Tax=Cervus canadensis TaxID=1574408 RepID=UPI001CA3339C|nr:uncharacterized protein LOC122427551 isoform X2 [Cervus canadensis]